MKALPVVDSKDRNYAVISTVVLLLLLFLYLVLNTFQMADPPPRPFVMKTETVIDEIVLDNLKVESGNSGGGSPSDAPVAPPQDQTQQVLTQTSNPKSQTTTGKSNQTTENNAQSTPTSAKKSNNPFGTGGADGKDGIGAGGPFGNDQGVKGDGKDKGNGDGSGRIRLNDPNVEDIRTNTNVIVYLKLTINAEGIVVAAMSTSKTTTTDQRIINQVIAAVKAQVKYNKDPGSSLVTTFLTVKVNAT
jgi:hypothetical protein